MIGPTDFQTPPLALSCDEKNLYLLLSPRFLFKYCSTFLEISKTVCILAQLKEHPADREDYEEYSVLSKWVNDFAVTNDASERGVKNAQEVAFVGKKECVRENAVLVMNTQRSKCPSLNKSDLANLI